MNEMTQGYPFVFSMNDKEEANGELLHTLQYRFKSTKSNHTYIVRVECYIRNVYCIKFFDKANMNSLKKFSLYTNTFEPRTIFYTLYRIFLDVLKERPKGFALFYRCRR